MFLLSIPLTVCSKAGLLSHHVDTTGIHAREEKVQVIWEFTLPATQHWVWEFIGLVNFYPEKIPLAFSDGVFILCDISTGIQQPLNPQVFFVWFFIGYAPCPIQGYEECNVKWPVTHYGVVLMLTLEMGPLLFKLSTHLDLPPFNCPPGHLCHSGCTFWSSAYRPGWSTHSLQWFYKPIDLCGPFHMLGRSYPNDWLPMHFCIHGSHVSVLYQLITDRSRQFESQLWTAFMKLLGTKHLHIITYHPIVSIVNLTT